MTVSGGVPPRGGFSFFAFRRRSDVRMHALVHAGVSCCGA